MADSDIFKTFDFGLLDTPDFQEDSVREELVVPLLAALGYSASPPHQIIRSRRLQHPYVLIGTVKKPVSIIPDYLLQHDGENAWILDAKNPQEPIDAGKNVEQAYSYAIHPHIRVPIYALCNGHRLTVFSIYDLPAVLDVSLEELADNWLPVLDLLGTKAAWPEGRRPGFLPDFGLALRKAGLDRDGDGEKFWQLFTSVPIEHLNRLEDDLYSLTSTYRQEYEEGKFSQSMLTFDFDSSVYQKLLLAIPEDFRERVRDALRRQPYQVSLGGPGVPLVTVAAEPGDVVRKNENESYCPFIAEEVIPEPPLTDIDEP